MSLPWRQPLAQSTVNKVKVITNVQENDLVLDFGAGFGRYSDLFASIVGKENVYTVEVDQNSIIELEEKGYKNILKPEKPKFPYPDNYFDVIFSSNVLEHIEKNEYEIYLKEIHRVLKPGKRFMVGIPSYPFKRVFDIKKAFKTKNYKYYLLDDPTHINKMNVLSLEKDLKKYFSFVELQPSVILFENWLPLFKKYRYRLRFFADKISGYCVK
jgi:ubiquinone/menaquinone biosynthesis C-methylase UbiE